VIRKSLETPVRIASIRARRSSSAWALAEGYRRTQRGEPDDRAANIGGIAFTLQGTRSGHTGLVRQMCRVFLVPGIS